MPSRIGGAHVGHVRDAAVLNQPLEQKHADRTPSTLCVLRMWPRAADVGDYTPRGMLLLLLLHWPPPTPPLSDVFLKCAKLKAV